MRQRQQAARSPGVGIRDGGTIRLSDNETGSGRNDDGKRWRGRFRFQVLRRAELVLGFWYYKEWGHLCHHGIGVRTLIVERADDRLRSREAISSLLGVETWLRHTELRGTQRSHQSLFGSFSISVLLASHQRFQIPAATDFPTAQPRLTPPLFPHHCQRSPREPQQSQTTVNLFLPLILQRLDEDEDEDERI